ncbi:heat shock factor-binding protein [Dendrobium catenatum]|uniref:heat shock factor-binding protein n=1 Tax=Dendrobium catenatum TaxID=906689 RepID=UPI0009F6DE9B|nr:heat shock factor-binding protein [Dendrobium catenatum]
MAATPNSPASKGEHESDELMKNPADMTAFVQNLLVQMQTRFQTMSESIIGKIDEMGSRIDELEQSINDLKTEMGGEVPIKKPEEPKNSDGSS